MPGSLFTTYRKSLKPVDLLGFFLGLSLGLMLLGWQHVQQKLKLKQLIQRVKVDTTLSSLPVTSRLTRAIAAYQEAEHGLEQELQTWKQMIQIAPVGFLQVDEDNQLLWCNSQACDLLSVQPFQLSKPRLLLEVVRSYELDELIEQTRQVRKPCQRDWTFYPTHSDPSRLSQQQSSPLRAYGLPMTNGCVGVFLESREEALSLIQQRDRWISDAAHELKTPLTSIRLVAETLQSRLEPPLRDWVDRLLKETIRLSSLVQDLLDLSQLEAQSIHQLSLSSVDLTKLIQSTWLSLEPLARKKVLQLDYVGPEHLLTQVNEAGLHRVLLNLLDNSIKYSPMHQQIRVQLSLQSNEGRSTKSQICLEVIDAGCGFPEVALPHIFERFYRVDPSRARSVPDLSGSRMDSVYATGKSISRYATSAFDLTTDGDSLYSGSGSGLGLAIVQQIIEAHGGSVRASNHPETGGAWLQVFLPWQPELDIQDMGVETESNRENG
ncbi:ATP-binding protein [Pantanalinema sp. GBBB05]|uniref:ATP-binding protein n=1 Tax=Pantanalinema sp. GBBB05 TaxID=2604139 RepID=UPI003D8142AE